MSKYILDDLMKYHCFDCDKEFILSEYQAKQATATIICPYCHSEDIDDYVYMDDEDILEELGCMAIGHYEDPVKEAEAIQRVWGTIAEARQKSKEEVEALLKNVLISVL